MNLLNVASFVVTDVYKSKFQESFILVIGITVIN